MKKNNISLELLAILLLYIFIYIVFLFLFPTIKDGMSYPYDNLVRWIRTTALLIPIFFSLIMLILTKVYKSEKLLKEIKTSIIIFAFAIPVLLMIASILISNYDHTHHEPKPSTPWKNINTTNKGE